MASSSSSSSHHDHHPTTTATVFRHHASKIQPVPFTLPSTLAPNEVLLRITHSGLCHSDMYYLNSGMALGHEGVGVVERVGDAVTELKVGDRAGGGYHRWSCGKCTLCLSSHEIYCPTRDIYGEASFSTGTFGSHYIGLETYLHKIPAELSSTNAAPLQCAGATVYNALIDVFRPGDRVGVVGIGGLGHLAIQFAAKLGAEVVVFSSSPGKEDEARGFGASEFVGLSEPEKVKEPVQVLVLTGNGYPDFSKFLTKEILARTGTIVPLTADGSKPMTLPSLSMFFNGYNVHSSLVANRKAHDDMLRFAARHGIRPAVELFSMDEKGWGEALERLKSGKVRYRAVLCNE